MQFPKMSSVAVAALLSLAPSAAQAVPIFHIAFTEPSGTASATDIIDVYVTVTVDPAGETLSDYLSDNAARVTDFETELLAQNFDLSQGVNFYFSANMTCSSGSDINTFIGGSCNDGPYDYNFNISSGLALGGALGSATDSLFVSFVPKGGVVPGGTYTLYDVSFFMGATGFDANGDPVYVFSLPVETSILGSQGAPFVRRVTGVVPEPASWALMILGFGAVGSVMRRRPSVAVRFG